MCYNCNGNGHIARNCPNIGSVNQIGANYGDHYVDNKDDQYVDGASYNNTNNDYHNNNQSYDSYDNNNGANDYYDTNNHDYAYA